MKTLMFTLFCLLTLGIALPVLAAPTNNPNFVTRDEVQMIVDVAVARALADAGVGKKTAEPPIEISIIQSECKISGNVITVKLDRFAKDGVFWPQRDYFWSFEAWGVAHLPQGDFFSTNSSGNLHGDTIDWEIPPDKMPAIGTSIPIEAHAFYAGKSWDFETVLVVPQATTAKPTYFSNNVQLFHGNYGNSSIPCIISDETGDDLHNGNYGMYDWLFKAKVLSDTDYYTRYDEQKGYGLPWVSWESSSTPAIITFDMKEIIELSKISLHCYYRLPDILLPSKIVLESSNDGITYQKKLEQGGVYCPNLTNDSVQWANIDGGGPYTGRFFRITVYTDSPGALFIDEIAINGNDGDDY